MRTMQKGPKTVYLSEEVYKIVADNRADPPYPVGTYVRLISGVDDSDKPGYHFRCDFRTVSRLGVLVPNFVGVPAQFLEPVEPEQVRVRESLLTAGRSFCGKVDKAGNYIVLSGYESNRSLWREILSQDVEYAVIHHGKLYEFASFIKLTPYLQPDGTISIKE